MAEVPSEKRIEEIYSIKDIENMLSISSILIPDNIKDQKQTIKKKKKVTIKKDIDIINIEAWKEFNIDVSECGGCPEWDKTSIINYDDDIYEYENETEICSIF